MDALSVIIGSFVGGALVGLNRAVSNTDKTKEEWWGLVKEGVWGAGSGALEVLAALCIPVASFGVLVNALLYAAIPVSVLVLLMGPKAGLTASAGLAVLVGLVFLADRGITRG